VVWSRAAERASVIDLASGSVDTFGLSKRLDARFSDAERQGRALFRDGTDPRIAFDGRACESCHPDGRDDGLTWSTPAGPRQTIPLAGRLSRRSHFGWFGTHRTLRQHLRHTMNRLGGVGFERSVDAPALDALERWLQAMPAPTTIGAKPVAHASSEQAVARGRRVFAKAGCDRCHIDGGTDLKRHDVDTGHVDEASLAFLTPSLAGIGTSAPYLHHSAFESLEQMLLESPGPMGGARHESAADRDALVKYLESLQSSARPSAPGGELEPANHASRPFEPRAPTGPHQAMVRGLVEERGANLVSPLSIDLSSLPRGTIEPMGGDALGYPLPPAMVLTQSPEIASWERDGIRFAPHGDALQFAPALYGTTHLGEWMSSVFRLTRELAVGDSTGRFVRLHTARLDEGPSNEPHRYRELTGFVDRKTREIRITRRVDLAVRPVFDGAAFAVVVQCEDCSREARQQLVVVWRNEWNILESSSLVMRPGHAERMTLTTKPMQPESPTGAPTPTLDLELSWAQREPSPTLVGWLGESLRF